MKREHRVFGVWAHWQGRSAKVCLYRQARFIVEISITWFLFSSSCLRTTMVSKLLSSIPPLQGGFLGPLGEIYATTEDTLGAGLVASSPGRISSSLGILIKAVS